MEWRKDVQGHQTYTEWRYQFEEIWSQLVRIGKLEDNSAIYFYGGGLRWRLCGSSEEMGGGLASDRN